MEPIVVFPDPPLPELARTLDLGGYAWKAAPAIEVANRLEPANGWAGSPRCRPAVLSGTRR